MDYQAIAYREEFGCWWPTFDHKPENGFAEVRRGLPTMDFAVGLCSKRRVAVQAGGHAGLWPLRLSRRYDRVYTFEPQDANFECLLKNCEEKTNITATKAALGSCNGEVLLRPSVSAGTWRVDTQGKIKSPQTTIDSLKLKHCDAIFLDIEGYEPEALRGARETIDRCKPIIQVEMLPRAAKDIADVMVELGYYFVRKVSRDSVYSPNR